MAVAEGIAIGTAIAPGIGTAVGGIIGAGIDIFNFFSGSSDKKRQEQLQLDQAMAEGKAKLTELTTKAGAYQDFLNKMPVAGKLEPLKGTTGDLAFDQQYRALLENYGNVNVMAGVTGRVGAGTTGAALGAQAEDLTSAFVTAEKDRASQQLKIYQAGITATKTGLDATKEADYQKNRSGLFGHGGFLGLGL